jgi:methionyl-tRNA formyltransferase
MKLIFAGTPIFAAQHLETLLKSEHEILAVFTQPDRPAGRGQKLTQSPVKILAMQHNIPVHSPEKLNADAQKILSDLQPDFIIVVAYGLILPKAVLTLPKFACINVHASLLPLWRGAAPIQRSLLAGDQKTGITIMLMDAGLDTGDMLYQVICPIDPKDTSDSLHQELAKLGQKALLHTLNHFFDITPAEQDNAQACYANKIHKSEANIHWEDTLQTIDQQIRAFNSWPVAQTKLGGKVIRIWEAEPLIEKTEEKPGTILNVNNRHLDVAVADGGLLRILKLQCPGGKVITAENFIKNQFAEIQEFGCFE